MKEYGFEVVLYNDSTSLWTKLKRFYEEALASDDDYFVRIDADIIPNKNVQEIPTNTPNYPLWRCSSGYDWYKQDRGSISVHYMNRLAIEKCLKYIDEAKTEIRPETYVWRKPDINMYTGIDWTLNRGIHGYGQSDHRDRIRALKHARNQNYDWKLIEKIEALDG